jgi:hypothetical protein
MTYRKTGGSDDFWRRLKARLAIVPEVEGDASTVITHFTAIEANGIVAIFDVYLADVGLAIGRVYWRAARDTGAEFIELPFNLECPDPGKWGALHARLLVAARAYARSKFTEGERT